MPKDSRTVRIFISSTFHDMHAERDYLVRHAFPELRARCRARQIELVEVDLRWGITRSQAESGKTLPRCLETIHACRPYFLGLIGERYGWIPQRHEIPDWLFIKQPWLQEHLDRSVTELEILHGVLNNPAMNDRAFFFLREGRESSPAKTTHVENPENQLKLRRLKERLRNSPYPCHPYRTPVDLGKQVVEELWRAIDNAFPPQEVPDEFAQDAAEQRLFVASRLQVHTPRDDCRSRLDAHLAATSPPLVIIGESGLGKSALLADWSETVQRTHPQLLQLRHFIGASRLSARPQNILRRWIHELQRWQGAIGELPTAPDELAVTFDSFLTTTATQEPILLIIDALNQLEGDGSSDLHWLPVTFPASVRVVVSTTPGPCVVALQRRGWTLARLDPPDLALRRRMVSDHLSHYGKELEEPELNAIASAPQAANPLFLRVLLDELRITARFQNLQQLLTRYLRATDLPDLFDRMLQRWERDYDPKKTGRVADSLTLLAVSHRGLSEHEILELLGDRERNRPLPQARWTPFYQAGNNYLIDRSGFFWFFHDHLRQAVERRYLTTPQERCAALFCLTDYYCEQISRDHLAAGSYRALAVEVAEDALACAETTGNKRLQAEACLNASGALLGAAVGISDANVLHFNRMVELNERGCSLAQQAGAKDIEADALCRRAGDETLNNPDFGRWELIDRAIELRRSRRDWAGVRDGLRDKARIGMRLNRLDITDACLYAAEEIEQQIHDSDRQWAEIHHHQYWGECRALQRRYPEALNALNLALHGALPLERRNGWIALDTHGTGTRTRPAAQSGRGGQVVGGVGAALCRKGGGRTCPTRSLARRRDTTRVTTQWFALDDATPRRTGGRRSAALPRHACRL